MIFLEFTCTLQLFTNYTDDNSYNKNKFTTEELFTKDLPNTIIHDTSTQEIIKFTMKKPSSMMACVLRSND